MTVKHALLALLNHNSAHGYQLRGQMEEILGEPWSVNIGQIYSTLSRLERDGFVVRQPETEVEAVDRTVYEITGQGSVELAHWFREPLSRDYRLRDAVYAKLVLSHLSDLVSAEDLLQNQRLKLLGELHELTRLRSDADQEEGIHRLLLLESAIMHLEADLRWLDLCESKLEDLGNVPLPRYESRSRGRPPKEEGTT